MSDLSRDLKRAIDRAEEGAGTMPAREAVKLRPADWHAVCRIAREAASRLQAPAVAEVEVLEGQLRLFREERGYVVGWNDGHRHGVAEGMTACIEIANEKVDKFSKPFSGPMAVGAHAVAASIEAALAGLGQQPSAAEDAKPIATGGSWPAGCIKRNSCARNFRCMYGCNGSCPHEQRDIRDEVAAAIALRTGGSE